MSAPACLECGKAVAYPEQARRGADMTRIIRGYRQGQHGGAVLFTIDDAPLGRRYWLAVAAAVDLKGGR